MSHTSLTRSERFILNEVDSVPDKVASPTILKHASRLTTVGFRRVLDRMLSHNLLGLTEDGKVTLTFGGMCAMRDAGMEVQ